MINTVASAGLHSRGRYPPRETYSSETRADIAVLASVLFLQRFGLPFFHTRLTFDFVLAALILAYQFAVGRVFIQYDRFFCYLVVLMSATSSLLLTFESRMLTSYGLFVLIYFLFTVSRPSTPEQYQNTLQGFQFLLLILSCVGIFQYLAQFIVSPGKLVNFFGIFPASVLPYDTQTGVTTGLKTNGIFLPEASSMSQLMALGIIVEVLGSRRPRYLVLLTLAFLLAYSGTGITILLVGLLMALLMNRRVQLPVLLIGFFVFGLLITGIIHLSAFTSRVNEFNDTHASGFIRYVSPFWMAADYFPSASLARLLLGNGPGGVGFLPERGGDLVYQASGSAWFNLIYYYGLVGALVFTCFWVFCFRRSRCPKPLLAALIYYHWGMGNILGTSTLIIMVVLCTLNGPEPRHPRVGEARQYRSPLAAGSVAG
jgi:hypothetical protein